MVPSLFIIVVVIICIIFAAASLVLGIFVKKPRIIKYIPAGIAGAASVAFHIKSLYFSNDFGKIGYFIFAVIAGGVFVISLLPAIIMGFVNRRK